MTEFDFESPTLFRLMAEAINKLEDRVDTLEYELHGGYAYYTIDRGLKGRVDDLESKAHDHYDS